jgi:TRAP-type C4-dicarboxylate transport system permease small subunit
MPPKIARLAGLGALGACAAFIALFAYVAYISRRTSTGGMMPALSVVTWISVGLVVLALIGAHVVIAKQLLHIGKGGGARGV